MPASKDDRFFIIFFSNYLNLSLDCDTMYNFIKYGIIVGNVIIEQKGEYMFEIGDKIVYPIHGAGVIVDIKNKVILGEKKEYFVLKIPVNEMKVLVPIGSMDSVGIREIKTPEEMDKVLEVLKDTTVEKMPNNWNRRYRFHQDKIKTGDLEEIARVIKNLECLDREKALSTGERKILNNARQIILSEMVLVYDKSYDEVVEIVDKTMDEGCLKAVKGEE